MRSLIVLMALLALAGVAEAQCANTGVAGTPYEGFSPAITGAPGAAVYTVTSLLDSGPGTLREAIDQNVATFTGGRCVQFGVSGTITLSTPINVRGNGGGLTVDGFTAPSPGITVTAANVAAMRTAMFFLASGDDNVIFRGFRIDGAEVTNGLPEGEGDQGSTTVSCGSGATRILMSQMSLRRTGDDTINYGANCSNSGVQGSIVTKRGTSIHPTGGFATGATLVFSRNLYDTINHRLPLAVFSAAQTPATYTIQYVNNLVWQRGARGIQLGNGATANVVNSYFNVSAACLAVTGCPRRDVIRCGSGLPEDNVGSSCQGTAGAVYIAGNVNAHGETDYLNAKGTRGTPWPAPAMTTLDACTAAAEIRATSGARNGALWGLDSFDLSVLATIPTTLPGCDVTPPLNHYLLTALGSTHAVTGVSTTLTHLPGPTLIGFVHRACLVILIVALLLSVRRGTRR